MNKNRNITFSELYPLICEAINTGKNFSFTAFGNSMSPFIRGGLDRVVLSPISTPLKRGDIIFYRRRNNTFVLHRIVRIRGNEFIMCGDNQFIMESGIQSKDIIAILTSVERASSSLFDRNFFAKLWCFCLPFKRFISRFHYYFKKLIKTV